MIQKKKILLIANANAHVFSHSLFELPLLSHIITMLNRVYVEHVFQLRVAHVIKKRENDDLMIYAFGKSFQQKLRSQNVPFKPLEMPTDMGLGRWTLPKQTDDTFFSWCNIKDDERYTELLRYNDVLILDANAVSLHDSLRGTIFLINCLSEIIEKEHPDEIIVTEDDIIGRTASIIGLSKNVPTITMGKSTSVAIRKFRRGSRPLIRSILRIENLKYRIPSFSIETQGPRETVKNKIIVFALCPSDVNTIAPVVKMLKEKDAYELRILGLSKSTNKLLKNKNLPFKTFDDYLDRGLLEKKNDESIVLRTKWEVLKNDVGFRNSFKYEDFPLWSLIEDKIELLFTMDLNIETVKHVLDVERPDLLVTLSMGKDPVLRVANALAKMRGIPTLFVSHSTIVSASRIMSTINADKIAVCGDDLKKNFINAGINPKRIVITGQPRFDVYFKKDDDSKDKIRRKLGIDPSKGIILLIAQTNGPFSRAESEALLKGVFGAMKEFPGHHLVVKLHPDESDRLAREIANKMKVKDVTIIKDVDLVALLKSCDVLLTIISNVGVEALILDKPVIIVDLTDSRISNDVEYTRGSAVLRVFSSEEIVPAIRSVLEDSKMRRDLKAHRKTTVYTMAYKPDGKASERVANLMMKMVKEKKSIRKD